jgi:hypothetical protein
MSPNQIISDILAAFRAIPVPSPRTGEWRHLRMAAMREIREKTGMKVEAIGELFGVHFSTVVYAVNDSLREHRKQKAVEKSRQAGILPLVGIEAVRQHIINLSRQGVGARAISAASGYPTRYVRDIKHRRRERITAKVARRILAVDASCANDHAAVPSGVTWNLLQELVADGWTEKELAIAMGCKSRKPRIYIGINSTSARTAMKVRRLYDAIEAGTIQRGKVQKSSMTPDDAFARRAA